MKILNSARKIIASKSGGEMFWKTEEAVKKGKLSRERATAMYQSWLESHEMFPPARKSVPYTIQQKYVSQRAYDNKYENRPGYRFVEKTADDKILIEYKVVVDTLKDELEEVGLI